MSRTTLEAGLKELPPPDTFDRAFMRIAYIHQDPPQLAKGLLNLIPSSIRTAEVGIDKLTARLRYQYGPPFDRVAGHRVFGTHQLNEVWQIYFAIRCASKCLRKDQLDSYLSRLADEGKHNDALLEMRPVMRVPWYSHPQYEVSGAGSRSIDWSLHIGPLQITFDVKNRVRGAIAHMEDVVLARARGDSAIPAPKTDAEAFFRSTTDKFAPKQSCLRINGVWAHVHIKENAKVLEDYFRKQVDPKRIDFLIIAGWTNECFVLTRSPLQKWILLSVFSLKESDNWTF